MNLEQDCINEIKITLNDSKTLIGNLLGLLESIEYDLTATNTQMGYEKVSQNLKRDIKRNYEDIYTILDKIRKGD